MSRGKRSDHDTTTSNVLAFDRLKHPIIPTGDLSDNGARHFARIIASRERSTWNELDIHTATQLAIVLDQIDQMQTHIAEHGWFVSTPSGSQKRSPTAQQLDALFATQRSLTTTLGLSAAQRKISGQAQVKRNDAERQAQSVKRSADDSDGILA